MDLIRKHLMIEGQIDKDCLTRILRDVSRIYRKSLSLNDRDKALHSIALKNRVLPGPKEEGLPDQNGR